MAAPQGSKPACPPGNDAGAEGDPSLYCIDLVPVPDLPQVAGMAEMLPPETPFDVAVDPDGHLLHDLRVTASGLPDPATLGPYSSYVGWATTPLLDPVVRLGKMSNGRNSLGRVGFNKFLILVTAEASPPGERWKGKIVLRGNSPSALMQPHAIRMLPAQSMHGHARHASGWRPPPMHPGVPVMIPGLEALEPSVAPFQPAVGLDPATMPEARPEEVLDLRDGDTLALAAVPVRRTIAGRRVVMYGYNTQYPGPLIRVTEGATIVVEFTNRIDRPTSVHWHGVRLENASDGVPGVTQAPVPPGGRFRYRVHFRDAGLYWYHPHLRADAQQDLGLYGNLLVRSRRPDYFEPADREVVLMLDDLLMDGDGLLPFGDEAPSHALMGRFGNAFLVNGAPDYRLSVRRGEVVRFFLTNASNARTYNLSLGEARLKLVGADGGLFERERWAESVVLAPAERYVVEARFERAGELAITNRVQAINHVEGTFFAEVDTLGRISVVDGPGVSGPAARFERLRVNDDVVREMAPLRAWRERPPDRTLLLTLRVRDLPFGLVQVLRLDSAYVNPVEWSGTMPMMDWLPTGRQVEWVLRDLATGRENMDIDWTFRRGEVVKLRLVNDRHTLHAMQHAMHVHGQRFVVLAKNGVPNDDLVWKDTVLVPAGATVDLLVELANPGRWMLHCHIAEHLEAGMHTVFTVN